MPETLISQEILALTLSQTVKNGILTLHIKNSKIHFPIFMAKMPGRLTAKFKNAESFYIKQSYLDANGKSTSRTIRKLGTLNQLLIEHGPTRDDVIIYYQMGLNRVCRKIHDRHHYGYDLNAIREFDSFIKGCWGRINKFILPQIVSTLKISHKFFF